MTFRSHKIRLCCTAQFVALVAMLGLSGCGTVGLFGEYDLPEDPAVEAAPWPRLIDVPTPPEAGTFSESAPDPENGTRAQTDLSTAAVYAEERAKSLSGPVISKEEKDRLFANAIVNKEQVEAIQEAEAKAKAQAEAAAKAKAKAEAKAKTL